MGMIRKQVFITADQNEQLKRRAALTGVAEAEIVRRGIDMALAGAASDDDWRAALDEFARMPKGDFDGLAERVAENRRIQSELWRKKSSENRRKLSQR